MTFPGLPPIASIVLETPPLEHAQWWSYLESFLQDAGAFALMGLWVWLIAAFARSVSPQGRRSRAGVPLLILGVGLLALALYASGGIGGLIVVQNRVPDPNAPPVDPLASVGKGTFWNHLLTAGGCVALIGVFAPFLLDCRHLRFRRIWALVRLSFVEAMRRRILWVFLIFLLLFLFPPKWFFPIKAEDEIRSNVNLVHFGATAVLLLSAAALAAFSIPTDIRNQTIHTVVTKPVEKFEIVMGRFLGYLGLTTLVMLAVFGFALLMLVASRVDPEAKAESMKARVPVYGDLGFQGPTRNFQGESVGREWEYRRYIPGGVNSPYRALWYFFDVDSRLANLPYVNCEFEFDIFRTTKGEENKGVQCTFFVATGEANRNPEVTKQYHDRTKGLSPNARPDGSEAEKRDWEELTKVVGELGYYEYRSKEIADYHTDSIPIPSSLFAKAMSERVELIDIPGKGHVPGPRVLVAVRCDSRTQFLGVAKADLYLLAKEGNFYLNFFEGSLGLWLRLCLVIGIAVTCSTYLNGVVSFLVTAFLVGLGFFRPFVIFMVLFQVAPGMANPGPADSLRKLMSNESLGAAPDANNPTHQVTEATDQIFRWCMRRVISMIPHFDQLTWQDYVANGFSVPSPDLFWNFMTVVGYLSLWAVMAHYLMKWREVATW